MACPAAAGGLAQVAQEGLVGRACCLEALVGQACCQVASWAVRLAQAPVGQEVGRRQVASLVVRLAQVLVGHLASSGKPSACVMLLGQHACLGALLQDRLQE